MYKLHIHDRCRDGFVAVEGRTKADVYKAAFWKLINYYGVADDAPLLRAAESGVTYRRDHKGNSVAVFDNDPVDNPADGRGWEFWFELAYQALCDDREICRPDQRPTWEQVDE
jgi:hypothetical protein